jgi:hypothetical protein
MSKKRKTKNQNTNISKKTGTTIPDLYPGLVQGKFWMLLIPPGEPKLLGKNLFPGVLQMWNHGPGSIKVDTGFINDSQRIPSGEFKMIRILDKIEISITDGKPAKLEFDMLLAIGM